MNNIPAYIRNPMLIGAGVGLSASALCFFTVDWYHNLVVWSWTNPWMWLVGVPCGIAAVALSDEM